MKNRGSRGTALALRLALALTAVSLWVYIPYRYATRPPELDGVLGTAYAVLFPLSALLAWWSLRVGLSPRRVPRARGVRWILGAYGGAWLAMGLMCVPSLVALSAVSPVQGLFATLHMTAQHVLLGLAALTAAWRPEALTELLRGPVPEARPQEAGGTT